MILLCAGGTGGHLFPAESLAVVLEKRGVTIDLATDTRAAHFKFPARAVHLIPSATLRGRDPLSLARTATLLAFGTLKALRLIGRLRPAVVVGFGGYPTVPPLFAASLRGVPTVLHEQNGVMGRANRLLAARVTCIATGFRTLAKLDPHLQGKINFTGNPVRPAVIAAASTPYPEPAADAPLQPARCSAAARAPMSWPRSCRRRLRFFRPACARGFPLCSRCAPRTWMPCARSIRSLGIAAECAPFFADLPARMAAAHLVVSRSGASTVAELSAIGRPAILVPLPHALDQDQFANAGVLAEAGAAIRLPQRDFTPQRLADEIATLAADPARLAHMAQAAKAAGTLDAAERLADLVLKVAGL